MSVSQTTSNRQIGLAPAKPVNAPRTAGPITNGFIDQLDSYNTKLWEKADGWANGTPFYCGWKAENVTFAGGKLVLKLDNTPSSGMPYSSGEYRTKKLYGYGTVEARIKAAKVDGVMGGSLFICTGPWDSGNPRDEIDIEFIKGQLQVNYFKNGVGGHEKLIDLGFDPSKGFHTYKIEWLPNRISWYVDGKKVHTEDGSNGPLPTTPGRIMANLWPGDGTVDAWLGTFTYSAPLTAEYADITYIKYTP